MTAGSRTWLRQGVMTVNEAAGNDENPGTLISPIKTNREAARRLGPSVVLTDFGATMNSTGNDAQAWADAVGTLKSLPYGGRIILPPGISNIPAGAIDLSGFSAQQQLVIEGQGNIASRVRFNGQDFGFSANNSNNLTFRNFGVIGASGGAGQVISLQDCNNVQILGLIMNGAQLRMPAVGAGACIALINVKDVNVDDLQLVQNGVDHDQCYGIFKDFNDFTSTRHRYNNITILNLGAHFGIGLYSMTDVEIGDVRIDLNGKGNGSNDGYPVLLYDISIDKFDRNLIHDVTIKNCGGIGVYLTSARYCALSNIIAESTCLNQDPSSLPVAAISITGDYNTLDGAVIRDCTQDAISVTSDYCAVANVTAQNIGRAGLAIRNNSEGLVATNITVKNAARAVFGYGGTTIRNLTLDNIRGEEITSEGIRLSISYGLRASNCVMQDAGNIGYIIDDGDDNTLENCTIQYSDSWGFDMRGSNVSLINCRAKASKRGGVQMLAPRSRIWDCELWGLGTPGTLVGTVDLTTLILPGDLLGKTILLKTTDYQGAITVQTITFNVNAVTVTRVIDFINTAVAGVFASLTAGNHLKLRTESGTGTITITGGTALVTLGLTATSDTGAAMTAVEVNAAADDCDIQNTRYTFFGALVGSVVLVAGVATVYTNEIRDGDRVEIDNFLLGGTEGSYSVTITDSDHFVITSSSNTDTSVVTWRIQHRPFRPSDIPTLTYWSRSDPDPAITITVGALVTAEHDKSGHNILFSAAGGKEPTYLGYTSTINGVPTQLFDGVDDFKTSATTLVKVIPTPTAFEICASWQANAITTNHAPGAAYFTNAALIGDQSQYWGLFFRGVGPYEVGIYVFDVGEKVAEATLTLGTGHWIDAKLDTGNLQIAIDGNAFGGATVCGPIGLQTGTLEKGQIAGGAFFNGNEAEICIFSAVLTGPQRGRMTTYMNSRITPPP